jgi:hypothetical protein
MWQPTTKTTKPEPSPTAAIHFSRHAFSVNENIPKSKTSKRRPILLPSDPKRKKFLERNRLAAARCRVDKKQSLNRLRESWRELICKNLLLQTTISDMINDIRVLQSYLAHHSMTGACEMPAEIDRTPQRMSYKLLVSKLRVREENDIEMIGEKHTKILRSEQKESRAVSMPDGYFQTFPSLEILSFNETEPLM